MRTKLRAVIHITSITTQLRACRRCRQTHDVHLW